VRPQGSPISSRPLRGAIPRTAPGPGQTMPECCFNKHNATSIPSCRGVVGIEHDIVFGGASAQRAVSGAAPGVRPGSHLRQNVASMNHSTIIKNRINTKSQHQRGQASLWHEVDFDGQPHGSPDEVMHARWRPDKWRPEVMYARALAFLGWYVSQDLLHEAYRRSFVPPFSTRPHLPPQLSLPTHMCAQALHGRGTQGLCLTPESYPKTLSPRSRG